MGSLLLQHKRSCKVSCLHSGDGFRDWSSRIREGFLPLENDAGDDGNGDAGDDDTGVVCSWGGRRPSCHPQCSPRSASYSLPGKRVLLGPARVSLTSVQAASRKCFLSDLAIHTHTHTHTHTLEPNDSTAAGNPVHPIRCVRWAVVQGCWRSGSGSHVAAGVSHSFKDPVYQA